MSGSFDDAGQLDVGDGKILTFFGKKRSGKSVLGRLYAASYPGDLIVICANYDDGPFADPKGERGKPVHMIQGDVSNLPQRFPEHLRKDKEPITLRFQLDSGSNTFPEDQDAVMGLAMKHGDCAVLVHEIGLLAPAGNTLPHTRRFLHANRHRGVTGFLCGPRTLTTDVLVIGQSDVIHVFEMPSPSDRKRIADNIGWSAVDLDAEVEELGPHEYLRFDANEAKPEEGQEDIRMLHFEALPLEVVQKVP